MYLQKLFHFQISKFYPQLDIFEKPRLALASLGLTFRYTTISPVLFLTPDLISLPAQFQAPS